MYIYVGKRQILHGAKTSPRLASLLLRECFGPFGEAQRRARSSIIDEGFCHKKRTKVIQIAVTLNNESHSSTGKFLCYLSLVSYTHMQKLWLGTISPRIFSLSSDYTEKKKKKKFFYLSSREKDLSAGLLFTVNLFMCNMECLTTGLSLKLNLCQGKVDWNKLRDEVPLSSFLEILRIHCNFFIVNV